MGNGALSISRGPLCLSRLLRIAFEGIEETYQSPLLEINRKGIDGRFVVSKVLKTSRRGEWRDQRSTGGGPGGLSHEFSSSFFPSLYTP